MEKRNPIWLFEESLLVADIGIKNNWKDLRDTDPQIMEVSKLLQQAEYHSAEVRGSNFRNVNGVKRKYSDLATRRPGYRGKKTNGSKTDQKVIDFVYGSPLAAGRLSEEVRATLNDTVQPQKLLLIDEDFGKSEGGWRLVLHKERERSPHLRHKKINSVLSATGNLDCEGCGFNFANKYGSRGDLFIEVHHTKPLHTVEPGDVTYLEDLALLCANCHRIVHRGELLSIEGLKNLIETNAI